MRLSLWSKWSKLNRKIFWQKKHYSIGIKVTNHKERPQNIVFNAILFRWLCFKETSEALQKYLLTSSLHWNYIKLEVLQSVYHSYHLLKKMNSKKITVSHCWSWLYKKRFLTQGHPTHEWVVDFCFVAKRLALSRKPNNQIWFHIHLKWAI